MQHPHRPVLAQIIPVRRCNLACTYCNEYDKTSEPVPTAVMLDRIDRLAQMGTSIITFSGGEPTLHPDLDQLIARVRERRAIATMITNGLLLTPERIRGLNAAGLDYLQISIDNVEPDACSKKSLKVLDRKLQWLAKYAKFDVTINSVLGSDIHNPQDAYTVAVRARELGFTSTVGVLHDGSGQLLPLDSERHAIYDRVRQLETGLFSFAHFDAFQDNVARGLAHDWHCRAGARFLYVCEDGLVHYCSQQRGCPAIPLERYSTADLEREGSTAKPCAPLCTISCVQQTAMLDSFRERPAQTLEGILTRRRQRDPGFVPPVPVRLLAWMFLDRGRRELFGKLAVRVLKTD
jgi:MoaA/NifB/PqqE/SkfB family radical SAM enzyme